MNMNATAQMVTTTQVGCGKAKPAPTTGEQEMIALHATAAKLAGAEGIIVKPTTGEWTAVNGDLNTGITEIFPLGRHRAKTIADAHNAALAAEREKVKYLLDALIPFSLLAPEIPNNRKQLGVLTQENFIEAASAVAKVNP